MTRLTLAAAAMMVFAPVAAQAAEPAAPVTDAAPAKDEGDRVVCKKQAPIGSRIVSDKVCMTQRNWDRQREAAKDRTRRAQKVQGATNGN